MAVFGGGGGKGGGALAAGCPAAAALASSPTKPSTWWRSWGRAYGIELMADSELVAKNHGSVDGKLMVDGG